MSNVVQFLEALARNPKRMSADEYAALVVAAGLEPAAERALLASDPVALNRDIVAGKTFACLIFPAEEEPNQNEEQPEQEETPEQQDTSALAA